MDTAQQAQIELDIINSALKSSDSFVFRLQIPQRNYDYIGESCLHVTGYTKEEFLNSPGLAFKLIHPDYYEYMNQVWSDIEHGNIAEQYEYKIITKGGRVKWLSQRLKKRKVAEDQEVLEGIVRDISSWKIQGSTLKETGMFSNFLINHLPVAVITFDSSGTVVYCNDIVQELKGRKKTELLGLHYTELNFSTDDTNIPDKINTAIKKEENFSLDVNWIDSEGSKRYAEVVVLPIYHRGKLHLQTIIKETTKEVLQRQALSESEERFRHFTDFLPSMVFETDSQGYIQYSNQLGFEFTGYSQEDLASGLHFLSLISKEQRIIAQNRFEQGFNREMPPVEYNLVKKDSSIFPGIIYTKYFKKVGEPITMRGVVIDLTEIKEYEKALEKSRLKYENLIENIDEGVYAVENNEFSFVNSSMSQIFGFKRSELVGMNPWELAIKSKQDETKDTFIQKIIANDRSPVTVECLRKDGRNIFVEIRVSQIGEKGSMAGTVLDITERIESLEALKTSEQRYRNIVELSPNTIITVDVNGIITSANEALIQVNL